MRPAAILRVSGEEQVEGYSLDAQRHAIRLFCAARGWPEPAWHEEPAVSAWTDDLARRPVFAALLDEAERGRYDAIVVHKLDRFARSLIVTLRELQRLERAGVAFASVAEQMDFTTPIGRVVLTMLAAFAQYYSDNLSAEVKKGLAEKRRQGQFVGRPPFGALRVAGVLVVDPDRAEDLRQALELAAALSPMAAAAELNRRGIRPPRHAADWGGSSVQVLCGPAGAWLLGQGEPWRSLYEAARDRPRKPSGGAVTKTARMLTGLMRCACGGAVSYHSVLPLQDGTVRRHARCRDAQGRQGCRRWGRDADQIEAAATAWLFALPDPRAVVEMPESGERTAALDDRRRRVARLYRDGLMGEAEYERERDALRREAARLPASAVRREEVASGLALARAEWATMPETARRAFLAGLVETFVLEGGRVRPVWRPGLAAVFGDDEGGV
jgi:DNA invertase Pin-like site-specific DNA recombinase